MNILLSILENIINNIYLLYLFFIVSAFLQVVFPPYPGDIVLAFSGYISIIKNYNLALTIIIIILTTICSSLFLYYLGYKKGDDILNNRFLKKVVHPKRYKKAKNLLNKYGAFSIIISKFLPGVYTLILLFCGIFKYNKITTFFSVLFITIVHNSLLIYIGIKVGFNLELIKDVFFRYNLIIIFIIITISIIFYKIKKYLEVKNG